MAGPSGSESSRISAPQNIAGFLDPGHSATERFHALRAYASLHVQDQKHLEVIATFLDDPKRPSDGTPQPQLLDPEIVGPAVEALSAMRVAYQFAPRLRRLLDCQPGASASSDSATDRTAGNSRCALAGGVICGLAAGGSSLEDYKPQVVAFLHNSSARARVVRALAAAKQTPAFLPQIAAILNETGQPWNREDFLAALQAVSLLGRAQEFLPRITWALQQDDFDLKAEAIRTVELANIDQELRPTIVSMLKDPEALTRFAAVRGIASGNRAESYATALRDSMSIAVPKGNRELQWYCSALRALAETGRQEFRPLILNALAPDGSPIVWGCSNRRTGERWRDRGYRASRSIRAADTRSAVLARSPADRLPGKDLQPRGAARTGWLLGHALADTALYKLTIYTCSGGSSDARLLMTIVPRDKQKIDEALPEEGERRTAFRILTRLAALPNLPARLRERVSSRLVELSDRISWQDADLDSLYAARDALARDLRAQAESMQARIDEIEGKHWTHQVWKWSARGLFILRCMQLLWLALLAGTLPTL